MGDTSCRRQKLCKSVASPVHGKKIQNVDLVWSRLHLRPCASKDTYISSCRQNRAVFSESTNSKIEQPNHWLLLLHDKPQSCSTAAKVSLL